MYFCFCFYKETQGYILKGPSPAFFLQSTEYYLMKVQEEPKEFEVESRKTDNLSFYIVLLFEQNEYTVFLK